MNNVAEAGDVFVDTNVLIYATQSGARWHRAATTLLESHIGSGSVGWISGQIIREYLAAVTRPQGVVPSLDMEVALARVQIFTNRFAVAEDCPNVRAILVRLLRRTPGGGRQIYDTNIVATMLAHGITLLMTFNTADFRRFLPAIELVSNP